MRTALLKTRNAVMTISSFSFAAVLAMVSLSFVSDMTSTAGAGLTKCSRKSSSSSPRCTLAKDAYSALTRSGYDRMISRM